MVQEHKGCCGVPAKLPRTYAYMVRYARDTWLATLAEPPADNRGEGNSRGGDRAPQHASPPGTHPEEPCMQASIVSVTWPHQITDGNVLLAEGFNGKSGGHPALGRRYFCAS